MPVFRLKLLAFSLGAAIAGLTGTLFAGFKHTAGVLHELRRDAPDQRSTRW